MSGRKGDRNSGDSDGQADGGMAGVRAIAFPTPHHRQSLSLLSRNSPSQAFAFASAHAPSVGWSWAIAAGALHG